MELGVERPPHCLPKGGGGGGRGRDGTPAQYRVYFTTILAWLRRPVEGCRGTASSRTNLQVQFYYQNARDIMLILEEGHQPHTWCPQCDMFVPQEALNRVHPTSEM